MIEMTLEEVTELGMNILEYIHQNSLGSCYIEPTRNWYNALQLADNGLIGIAYNPKHLHIYIDLIIGELKLELDISRVIQNADGRYSWYLAVPRDPKNEKFLREFGLVLERIPDLIYKEMREQQKSIKRTDFPNVQKDGFELISNANRDELCSKCCELVKYIFSVYSRN